MWKNLSQADRSEYQKMILAFASLTKMFAQKAETDGATEILLSPIINSKYQETVFQRVFKASAEDIGNTSFDAAIAHTDENGHVVKYLIGIKTFGIAAGAQKVAQFKANHDGWVEAINAIRANAIDDKGNTRTKNEISRRNERLYKDLASEISGLRNLRIDVSEAKVHGFSVSVENDEIQTVYHVLMPSKKGDKPFIYVGETNYDKIDIDNIKVLGCTSASNPTNFEFTDGKHKYKYTSADSQLYMDFGNKGIIQEAWEVKYADDAYAIFSKVADKIYEHKEGVKAESYSWLITNNKGEVELFSGFNSFYGIGSKLSKQERLERIERIRRKYNDSVPEESLASVLNHLKDYLTVKATTSEEKQNKVKTRRELIEYLALIENRDFKEEILKILFRPKDELYIPIPNSVKFHTEHPDFFNTGVGNLKKTSDNKWKLSLPKEQCKFTLVFEPSGDKIESFITQDAGKAIESYEKQSYLGDWILRKVFQLGEYEPLTAKRLKEVGINGIRLVKYPDSNEIHLHFIWIDTDKLPEDYIK